MKKSFTNFKNIFVFTVLLFLFLIFVMSLYFNKPYLFIFLPVIISFAFFIYYLNNKETVNVYFRDIKFEFNSIKWIDKMDLRQTSFIILIIIFLTSLFLWIVDSILTYIVTKFI